MRWLRLLLIFLTFFLLEVRIKASDSHSTSSPVLEKQGAHGQAYAQKKQILSLSDQQTQPTTEPADCLKENVFPCSVQIGPKEKWQWSWKGGRLELGENSIVTLLSSQEIQFIEGISFFYLGNRATWIRTVYGDVASSDSILMLRRKAGLGEHIELSTLIGEATIYPRGTQALNLLAGYRNWLQAIDAQGSGNVGIPQVINKSEVLNIWPKIFAGNKEDFFRQARQFHQSWMLALDRASDLHRTLIERQLASVARQKKVEAERTARLARENRELRALYRRKNYIE